MPGQRAPARNGSSGVATWATFTDISMSGCYVEATAGYPVGAVLALTIEVNGFRVEASGEVRVAYPQLGMGISFTRMSEEDRERLRELLRSISPPSSIMGRASACTNATLAANVESAPACVESRQQPLQAMQKFFEDRHLMGREEFLRILQNHR